MLTCNTLLFRKSADESSADAHFDVDRISTAEAGSLGPDRRRVLRIVADEQSLIFFGAEERQTDVNGPRARAIHYGQKPAGPAAAREDRKFADLGLRQNDRFIPRAGDRLNHFNARIRENISRIRRVNEQRRSKDGSARDLMRPGGFTPAISKVHWSIVCVPGQKACKR